MKNILLILLLLFHFKSFSQLKSKLIDGRSKMPIGYVAIYIENGNIIATADENGEFTLPLSKDNENYLVFNALGYEIKKIKFNDITTEVI